MPLSEVQKYFKLTFNGDFSAEAIDVNITDAKIYIEAFNGLKWEGSKSHLI